MLLRTLVMSMSLTHTPLEAQFFCLDLGGGTMSTLENLPHVGGVANRLDPDKARRMIAEVTTLVTEREQRFRDLGIDSMTEFRNRKRRGEVQDDLFGDVFLIIDGWMNFRQEFESLEMQVVNLAAQGLSYGVHVIIAANRWAEIRPAVKDLMGTRFELRLGDPSESDIDRRTAVNVPAGRPGRGLSKDKLHFLVGLPRIDGSSNPEDVAQGVQDAMAKIKGGWRGRPAPKVRLLPDLMSVRGPACSRTPRRTPSSSRSASTRTSWRRCTSTSTRTRTSWRSPTASPARRTCCARSCAASSTGYTRQGGRDHPGRLPAHDAGLHRERDHLLGLRGVVQPARRAWSTTSRARCSAAARPGRHAGAVQEPVLVDRARSCSSIVDDYDLVAPQGNNPLQPLSEFLAQAKDVGLHLITVRRTGGASRALYDPIIGKLREIASPGLSMSGNKDEGVLLGTIKPSAMPPGRGTIVSRKGGQQRMQVAWIQPD